MKTIMERLMAKVKKTDSCWLWTGSTYLNGYGQININKKNRNAHRTSYELFKGKIPEGKLIRHTCDNRLCVNPEHLIPGTHEENFADMDDRGRRVNSNSHKTHCPQGHEYTDNNTYKYPIKYSGGIRRSCKTCILMRDKNRRRK